MLVGTSVVAFGAKEVVGILMLVGTSVVASGPIEEVETWVGE